ncbi:MULTISPECIES: hypothetical protein [Nocardia]|nr:MULTISPECIES: hypothetical protein [Nocardia]MBF6446221.1 hypothetical protein [Nocardia elegans]
MPHARDSAAPIRRWSTARRKLATDVCIADGSGRIPEARWMRAMTFERLVRDEKFVSEIATTTVGRLGLDRPTSVVTANALVQLNKTVALVSQAHTRALEYGAETLSTVSQSPSPASGRRRPPRSSPISSWWLPQSAKTRTWLIVGDAKDYEQVRSRIQATRLLKGFLQVAFGAEAAEAWARRPTGICGVATGRRAPRSVAGILSRVG